MFRNKLCRGKLYRVKFCREGLIILYLLKKLSLIVALLLVQLLGSFFWYYASLSGELMPSFPCWAFTHFVLHPNPFQRHLQNFWFSCFHLSSLSSSCCFWVWHWCYQPLGVTALHKFQMSRIEIPFSGSLWYLPSWIFFFFFLAEKWFQTSMYLLVVLLSHTKLVKIFTIFHWII